MRTLTVLLTLVWGSTALAHEGHGAPPGHIDGFVLLGAALAVAAAFVVARALGKRR
ncbi:MAG: hypothetical protein H6704_12745 [Myxococcales bacterium]|nr:hypothetical protein [Myxococcales bacterium]